MYPSDQGLPEFANMVVKLWAALGQSQPSLKAETGMARDINRAFIAGMLSTIMTLYGPDEYRKIRATIEQQVKARIGGVPSLKLQSGEQWLEFLALAEVEWPTLLDDE